MAKKKKQQPPDDGFYWEEWRGGVLIHKGMHDGTTLDGKDAHRREEALCIAIPTLALEEALYGKKKP